MKSDTSISTLDDQIRRLPHETYLIIFGYFDELTKFIFERTCKTYMNYEIVCQLSLTHTIPNKTRYNQLLHVKMALQPWLSMDQLNNLQKRSDSLWIHRDIQMVDIETKR